MIDAPSRALSGLLLTALLVAGAAAQDAAAINAEIKKVEEKLKEEVDRVAKKKENLQVEFAALNRPETKTALQAKLAEIGAKHKEAVAGTKGTDSKPKLT